MQLNTLGGVPWLFATGLAVDHARVDSQIGCNLAPADPIKMLQCKT